MSESSTVDTESEPVTITIQFRKKPLDVQAHMVVPGVAVHPCPDPHIVDRLTLTHTPSGLSIGPSRCEEHAAEMVAAIRAADIDWTRTKDEVANDPAVRALVVAVNGGMGCYGRCNPSTPAPPAWRVRCNTCDWELEDEDEEGCDAKQARYLADNHECEPDVEIAPPTGAKWYRTWQVGDDGAVKETRR